MYSLSSNRPTSLFCVFFLATLLYSISVTLVHSQEGVQNLTEYERGVGEVFNQLPVVSNEEEINKGIIEVFPPPPAVINNGCTCVSYFLCNEQMINTDGTGIIDIRTHFSRMNGSQCSDYLEVCCNDPTKQQHIETPAVIDTTQRSKCGHWNNDGLGFKITGNTNNEAEYGEFPWMVALLKIDQSEAQTKSVYFCGGSLIHPEVVMTAVHCIKDKKMNELIIRAGEWDSQTEKEFFPHQDRLVSKIIKHENYYGGGAHNDIALIFVEEPFVLRDNVGTICLPPQDFEFTNERCYSSGWGKNVFGESGVNQLILKKVDLPIVRRDQCLDLLRQTRLGARFDLHDSFICAGGEIGKDTCKGDGGGPLMCPITKDSQQFQQAGIVAWGIGCGDRTPGVYVKVSMFRNWIDQQMNIHNLNRSYYDINYNLSNI